MIRQYEGAIFDLDGTLLDSMGVWHRIDVDFLARRGFAVPEDYQQAITPLGARDAAVYTIDRFGLKETPEALMHVNRGKGFPDIYEKAAADLGLEPAQCAVYEDIIEGIRGARSGGFFAVGVYEEQYRGSREEMERESDLYIHSFRELLEG